MGHPVETIIPESFSKEEAVRKIGKIVGIKLKSVE